LDHWHRGRALQAISQSLGLDRKTVRKYVRLAEEARFSPGDRPPKGSWSIWLAEAHPDLNARGRYRPTVEQFDPLREVIRQALADVTPTTAWRRLRRAGCTSASLATLQRQIPSIRNDFWRGRTFTTFAEITEELETWYAQ